MGFETEEYGKLGGMESTSTLFEKVVPVRVTKANAEDRHMDLTARFIMGLSKIHRSTKVRTCCGWFDLPYVTQLNIQAEDRHHERDNKSTEAYRTPETGNSVQSTNFKRYFVSTSLRNR